MKPPGRCGCTGVKDLRRDGTQRADTDPAGRRWVLRVTGFHHDLIGHLLEDACDVALDINGSGYVSLHKRVDLSNSHIHKLIHTSCSVVQIYVWNI